MSIVSMTNPETSKKSAIRANKSTKKSAIRADKLSQAIKDIMSSRQQNVLERAVKNLCCAVKPMMSREEQTRQTQRKLGEIGLVDVLFNLLKEEYVSNCDEVIAAIIFCVGWNPENAKKLEARVDFGSFIRDAMTDPTVSCKRKFLLLDLFDNVTKHGFNASPTTLEAFSAIAVLFLAAGEIDFAFLPRPTSFWEQTDRRLKNIPRWMLARCVSSFRVGSYTPAFRKALREDDKLLAPLLEIVRTNDATVDSQSAAQVVANLYGDIENHPALASVGQHARSMVECFAHSLQGRDFPAGSRTFPKPETVCMSLANLANHVASKESLRKVKLPQLLLWAIAEDDKQTDEFKHEAYKCLARLSENKEIAAQILVAEYVFALIKSKTSSKDHTLRRLAVEIVDNVESAERDRGRQEKPEENLEENEEATFDVIDLDTTVIEPKPSSRFDGPNGTPSSLRKRKRGCCGAFWLWQGKKQRLQ